MLSWLRRSGPRVACRVLLVFTGMMLLSGVLCVGVGMAVEPPTTPVTTPPAPSFNFDNGLLQHPAVTPVNPQPGPVQTPVLPDPLADLTRAPVQFPVTAAPAPLTLGTVPVVTTLP